MGPGCTDFPLSCQITLSVALRLHFLLAGPELVADPRIGASLVSYRLPGLLADWAESSIQSMPDYSHARASSPLREIEQGATQGLGRSCST